MLITEGLFHSSWMADTRMPKPKSITVDPASTAATAYLAIASGAGSLGRNDKIAAQHQRKAISTPSIWHIFPLPESRTASLTPHTVSSLMLPSVPLEGSSSTAHMVSQDNQFSADQKDERTT